MTRLAGIAARGALAVAVGLALVQGHRAAAGPALATSDVLAGIDFVPDRALLDASFDEMPQALITIAGDELEDPGVRLRAIRALAQYGDALASKPALAALLAEFGAATTGMDVLYLRAAIEAFGDLGTSADVSTITAFLESDSLDIRAAAAHALRAIDSPSALSALTSRLGREQEPQVRWAITEAIRALND